MKLLRFAFSKDPGLILFLVLLTLLNVVYTIMGEAHWIGWLMLTAVWVVYFLKTHQFQRRLVQQEYQMHQLTAHMLRNRQATEVPTHDTNALHAMVVQHLKRFHALHPPHQ